MDDRTEQKCKDLHEQFIKCTNIKLSIDKITPCKKINSFYYTRCLKYYSNKVYNEMYINTKSD